MRKKVYVETTIVSYATADPSHDPIILDRQMLTREWWREHRHRYDLFASQIVLQEAGAGDPDAATKRIALLREMPLLDIAPSTMEMAEELIRRRLLPPRAATDAAHLAIATASRMDVLLTWNCSHLANADLLIGVGRFLRSQGLQPPLVCTPMEMVGGTEGIEE